MRNRKSHKPETIKRIREAVLKLGNSKYTSEVRKKMSITKKKQYKNGLVPWNKGKVMSEEYRQVISKTLKGKMGKLSRNWRGGITSLARTIRNSFRYRQWRSDCLTKDDYFCRICGIRGGILQIDHYPKSFAQILFENNLTTMEEALNCEELWNINNGRTLCVECHKTTSTYLKRYKNKFEY